MKLLTSAQPVTLLAPWIIQVLKIRKATQSDVESISVVHQTAVRAIGRGTYRDEEIDSWAQPKDLETYKRLIDERDFFVAEEDDNIKGFAILDPANALIEAVYVSPDQGRRGIGLKLMRKLEERARELQLHELRLNSSLNAVSFYERAGYVAHEPSKYTLPTGLQIACVPMTRPLES